MGVNTGVAVRVKEACPFSTKKTLFLSHCIFAMQSYVQQGTFHENISNKTFRESKFNEKISHRECSLEQHKKVAHAGKMNEEPSKVGETTS